MHEGDRILSSGKQKDGSLELGSYLAQEIDRLRLELLQMRLPNHRLEGPEERYDEHGREDHGHGERSAEACVIEKAVAAGTVDHGIRLVADRRQKGGRCGNRYHEREWTSIDAHLSGRRHRD